MADSLTIPIAGEEQEASIHNFPWLIAHYTLQIVQPDIYYFGGKIRSMKLARMAESLGITYTPYISGGLGYL
jgi:L-alanine-DL-glutamate epimerase-like enolase superfamily enzyme